MNHVEARNGLAVGLKGRCRTVGERLAEASFWFHAGPSSFSVVDAGPWLSAEGVGFGMCVVCHPVKFKLLDD